MALDDHDRARHGLDPGRPRSHDRRQHLRRRSASRAAASTSPRPRSPGSARPCTWPGPASGALFFGWLTDRFGRKKLFMITLGVVPGRHRADRAVVRALVVLPVPVPDRVRHRRRVRGDQLGHRRADPEPAPGPDRHRHQRHLLGRRGGRRAAHRARDQRPAGRRRLAGLLRPGRGARPGRPAGPAERAGEPALAVHPRPRPGGRGPGGRASSSGWSEETGDAPGRARPVDHHPAAQDDRLRHHRADHVRPLPAAHHPGLLAVHRPGVPVQRDHVRLRADPGHVLPRRRPTPATTSR